MIVDIRVIPNAKRNEVLAASGRLKVYLTAPPIGGEANKALKEILADYFKVRKSSIRIIQGERARNKTVEIEESEGKIV